MLINCAIYHDGHKLADLPPAEIGVRPLPPDAFSWVALKDATAAELAELQRVFGLHELAIEDASVGHQRPKVEEYGDCVFVVIHLVEVDGDELTLAELDVFAAPGYVISIRSRSRQDFLGVRARCERDAQLLRLGPGFVLYALIDAIVDRYFPVVDALETELEDIEAQIFTTGAGLANIRRLYALKRKVTVVRHAVAPLIEALSKLHGGRVPLICRTLGEYFRDVHDHLLRINAALEAIRDTIGTAIQVNLSMVTIEESVVNKRLAAWAGIFAVASVFAGIWGMNFNAMPELKWAYGYPMALGVIAASCGFLYYRFKKAGWI